MWIMLKFALLDNNDALYSSIKASFYNVQENQKIAIWSYGAN
jgi:hypothetical protein